MNTNWKAIVEKTNAKTYVLPPGWDSKAKVAEDLGCSEDRVRLLMAPGLKDQTIEKRDFQVWDKLAKRIVRMTAYHQVVKAAKVEKK